MSHIENEHKDSLEKKEESPTKNEIKSKQEISIDKNEVEASDSESSYFYKENNTLWCGQLKRLKHCCLLVVLKFSWFFKLMKNIWFWALVKIWKQLYIQFIYQYIQSIIFVTYVLREMNHEEKMLIWHDNYKLHKKKLLVNE